MKQRTRLFIFILICFSLLVSGISLISCELNNGESENEAKITAAYWELTGNVE
jgi:hypothetical protein